LIDRSKLLEAIQTLRAKVNEVNANGDVFPADVVKSCVGTVDPEHLDRAVKSGNTPAAYARNFFREHLQPSYIAMAKDDTAELYSEDGGRLGQVKYIGGGKFEAVDGGHDLRIGKEFWFLAGQFEGDPTVAFGKVIHWQHTMDEAWVKPRTQVWLRLANGYVTDCYDTDLHTTREEAEKARARQLEEEQG
jgi:hypothetical protein